MFCFLHVVFQRVQNTFTKILLLCSCLKKHLSDHEIAPFGQFPVVQYGCAVWMNVKSIHTLYTGFLSLFLYILLFFAHLVVFCTSCCFLHILLSFTHLIVFLHILLFCTFFYFIAQFTLISPFLTICMPLCYVTLYNLYSYYFALSTEWTWFDYISLLIIPCITYYVTNKETLSSSSPHWIRYY